MKPSVIGWRAALAIMIVGFALATWRAALGGDTIDAWSFGICVVLLLYIFTRRNGGLS